MLHARAHVPMAMALMAGRIRVAEANFRHSWLDGGRVCRMRGSGPKARCRFELVKRLERAGIRRADQIVVLTERLRDWLIAKQPQAGRTDRGHPLLCRL